MGTKDLTARKTKRFVVTQIFLRRSEREENDGLRF